jgi:heat shock protein 5
VVPLAIYSDEAVAHGATIQGDILFGEKGTEDIVLIDICLTLGNETIGRVFTELIPRNTVGAPTKVSQTFSTDAVNRK